MSKMSGKVNGQAINLNVIIPEKAEIDWFRWLEIAKILGLQILGSVSENLPLRSQIMKQALEAYGFETLEKIMVLDERRKNELYKLINSKDPRYQIAMLDYLGFFDYLLQESSGKLGEVFEIASKIIPLNAPDIDRNRKSLTIKKWRTDRYYSYKFKDDVIADYNKIRAMPR